MKKLVLALGIVLAFAVLAGAHLLKPWNIIFAREAVDKVEITVDNAGEFQRVEYSYDHTRVPGNVQQAMRAEFPGIGLFTGAKRAMFAGTPHFALLGQVGGLQVEAWFDAGAHIHSKRVEVPASKVPPAVQAAVQSSGYSTVVHQWLAIYEPASKLIQYHARTESKGRRCRLEVTPGGALGNIYYETVAELEVPVR